jgi:transcription elongation factor GreA
MFGLGLVGGVKAKKMSEDKIYVTKDGLENLKSEYDHLVNVRRKEVAEKLQKARELGDVTENAAYEAARDEQTFVEGRIEELDGLLKRVEIIKTGKEGKVAIGSRVKVHLDGDDQEFHIVGAAETDPGSGRISHKSPLGQALMGKGVGDKIEVEAPVGNLSYCILEIK